MNTLICGDVLEVLPTLGHFKCLIADPPDGIGLKYASFNDRITKSNYREFLRTGLRLSIAHADIAWWSFNAQWVFMVGSLVEDLLADNPDYEARLFIPSFTFGQNRKTDCGNGYRPLLRLKHKDCSIYPNAIKVPSWRSEHGDKRAAPGGRVPLDHWPEFPRITGNCKERRPHHPTQLREGMIKRIVDFSTLPGESVCDCFSGTGTVLRAVNDRLITSIELDPFYCDKIA
ncbi:MAG: DNA methyltransferase, partial [Candidatus Andersenbacteria bacterium]